MGRRGESSHSTKNQGRGLIVSDFVTEFDYYLQLTTDEYRRAAVIGQSDVCTRYHKVVASSARFLKQMESAVKITDIKYPSDTHSKVWIFNQSIGHTAFKEDSLNVNIFNVSTGCTQP